MGNSGRITRNTSSRASARVRDRSAVTSSLSENGTPGAGAIIKGSGEPFHDTLTNCLILANSSRGERIRPVTKTYLDRTLLGGEFTNNLMKRKHVAVIGSFSGLLNQCIKDPTSSSCVLSMCPLKYGVTRQKFPSMKNAFECTIPT